MAEGLQVSHFCVGQMSKVVQELIVVYIALFCYNMPK